MITVGPEMDKLVAQKVMGWRVGTDGRFIGPGRSWRPAHAFTPSVLIEHAWLVVERVSSLDGAMLSLQRMPEGPTRALFSRELPAKCLRQDTAAGTTPVAICLAALDFLGAKEAVNV